MFKWEGGGGKECHLKREVYLAKATRVPMIPRATRAQKKQPILIWRRFMFIACCFRLACWFCPLRLEGCLPFLFLCFFAISRRLKRFVVKNPSLDFDLEDDSGGSDSCVITWSMSRSRKDGGSSSSITSFRQYVESGTIKKDPREDLKISLPVFLRDASIWENWMRQWLLT